MKWFINKVSFKIGFYANIFVIQINVTKLVKDFIQLKNIDYWAYRTFINYIDYLKEIMMLINIIALNKYLELIL